MKGAQTSRSGILERKRQKKGWEYEIESSGSGLERFALVLSHFRCEWRV